MACPHLGVRCPAPVGGVRSPRLKPKDGPFHPGGHRLGKIGRVNTCEPLVDASLSEIPSGGMVGGVQGLAVAKRQAPGREVALVGVSTVVPGAQRAPTPIAARMCGTRKPRRGPAVGRSADREEGPVPWRAKDDREAKRRWPKGNRKPSL